MGTVKVRSVGAGICSGFKFLDVNREPEKPPVGSHRERLVQKMVEYIQAHYSRPLPLRDLAAALNMNPAYLSDLFSTTVGLTFHQYVEQLRLAKAQDLLCNPTNRICEVALAVGYTDPDHFRDVFKTRLGVPPSAWRNRAEGGLRLTFRVSRESAA